VRTEAQKAAQRKAGKKWRLAHPEAARAAKKKYETANPGRGREGAARRYRANKDHFRALHRTRVLKTQYGMTPEEYAVLLDVQDGVCAICRRPEMTIREGRVQPLSVDHDHATGVVRGLLCLRCNHGLGQFGDDVARLTSAIAYLQRKRHV
jgi:hypothetical protein